MADNVLPWFRAYHEASSDPKFDVIARQTGMEELSVFGAWWKILCIASKSPIRGSLYVTEVKRFSNDDVTAMLRLRNDQCNALMQAFTEMDMIDLDENGAYHIKNWEKRQFASDNSTPRVKDFRERQKKEKSAVTETPMKRFSNVSVTPPDTDTESDTDTYSADDESPLSEAFTRETNILPFNLEKWIQAEQELTRAKVSPEDITAAIQKMDETDLTYSGLWSVVNVAIGIKSKRDRNINGNHNSGKDISRINHPLPSGVWDV